MASIYLHSHTGGNMTSLYINSSMHALVHCIELSGSERHCHKSNGLSWRRMRDKGRGRNQSVCSQNPGKATSQNFQAMVLTEGSTAMTSKDPQVCARNGSNDDEIVTINGICRREDDADTTPLRLEEKSLGIVRFLKGKKFLVTGATGFLAKVLIEKILRTTPDVGKIYLLIKARDNQAAMDRMKSEIVDTELFRCLKEIHGTDYQTFVLSKLVPVAGDVREPNLGIQAGMLEEITEEVNVIVNSAANTTFDERYNVALDINTMGPSRLMCLAKQCKKLKLFMQVSTAYVNGQRRGKILEKPFSLGESIAREMALIRSSADLPPELDVEAEKKQALDSTIICPGTPQVPRMKELGLQRARMHGWQDTYAFTKAMGEMLLDSMRGDIPVINLRPSIIESTCREPFPGWIEGNRMMDPIILSYGKGQLNGFLTDPDGVLDVVPADMVINAALASMAKHGTDEKPGMYVYQIASSVINPLVFQDLAEFFSDHFKAFPFMDSKGMPIHVPQMKLFRNMSEFSAHVWADAMEKTQSISSPCGMLTDKQKNICMRSVEQAKYLANVYKAYTFYAGRFDSTNTKKLMQEMSLEERKSFDFDIGRIDWKDYISNVHIPGLRRHVMKGRGMKVPAINL